MPHLELRQVVVVLGHLEGEALHHGLLNRAHIRQRLLLALYHRLHTCRQSYCSIARSNEVHVEVDANIDRGLPDCADTCRFAFCWLTTTACANINIMHHS